MAGEGVRTGNRRRAPFTLGRRLGRQQRTEVADVDVGVRQTDLWSQVHPKISRVSMVSSLHSRSPCSTAVAGRYACEHALAGAVEGPPAFPGVPSPAASPLCTLRQGTVPPTAADSSWGGVDSARYGWVPRGPLLVQDLQIPTRPFSRMVPTGPGSLSC